MSAPPSFVGAENCNNPPVLMPEATKLVGASGTVPTDGVKETPDDAQDAPTELIALILMLYEVPLTNAVDPSVLNVEITNGEAVVPAARVRNDTPPSVEYL